MRTSIPVVIACLTGFVVTPTGASPAQPSAIPLCPGLTIVTAVSQADGDYESIKTIESMTPELIQLKYASERLVDDPFSSDPPRLHTSAHRRTVRRADHANAKLYLQQFSAELPEMVPETTALGTSTALLKALKARGEAEMGIFIAFSQIKPSIDRRVHPNVYDNQMVTKVVRASATPVMIPVTVNGVRVELPTIHARGDFFGDKSEFFFLDDENNPIALRFRIGIDAFKNSGSIGFGLGDVKPPPPDRDVLQVVKISHRCGAPGSGPTGGGGGQPPAMGGGGGTAGSGGLEAALATAKRADVYDIFFTFNSAAIREESEPTLKEIAGLLTKHADWKLSIEGHTDNIASDTFNLTLSRQRAAAVKDALVKRYKIEPARLTTSGAGEARPKDTNDTLEGRARNRRVELVRW
jgi:outer membrane protein OmpA-like peptidoglycan-associated protein